MLARKKDFSKEISAKSNSIGKKLKSQSPNSKENQINIYNKDNKDNINLKEIKEKSTIYLYNVYRTYYSSLHY